MKSTFQNYVSQRLLRGVGDRECDIFCAELGCDGRGFTVKLNGRTLPFRAHDFDVAPADSATPTRAQCFHPRFFGGEAGGVTFEASRFSFAISNFAVGENAPKKTFAEAFNAFADARDFGNIDSSANDHRDMLIANSIWQLDHNILEEIIAAIDYPSIDQACFSQHLVRARGAFRVNVKNFVPVPHKPVRDNHAMAAEVDALGTHIRGARGVRSLQQFGYGLFELRRQRVVGIVAEARIAERNMGRIFSRCFAVPAQSFHPEIVDALLWQPRLERLAIEVRQTPGQWEGADVYQPLDTVRLQGRHEFIEGASGMADGIEGCHGIEASRC